MIQFPTIEIENLVLRQFTNDDLENVFKGLSHPDVIKYYGISFKTLEETKEQLIWFADLEKNETGIWWAICSKKDGAFYGAGGFNNIEKEHKKAEIGFWLLPEHWGKGIMKSVMSIICDFGFSKLNLHRIEGFVDPRNNNCKNGLAKIDFNYEGTMVDCEMKDGKFISTDIYSLIKPKTSYNPQG
jgi:ribosomal-protein-alanine N-acetyltransferase